MKSFVDIMRNDIQKFNPYHDRLGRFTFAEGFMNSGYTGDPNKQARTFSANPETTAGRNAIERESALRHEGIGRMYGMGGGGAVGTDNGGTRQPEKPKYEYKAVSNNKEAAAYLIDSGITDSVKLTGINKSSIEHVNTMNETLTKLTTEYPISKLGEIKVGSSTTGTAAAANYHGLYPKKQFMNKPSEFGENVTTRYRENNKQQLKRWQDKKKEFANSTEWNAKIREQTADDMIKYYTEKSKYSRHNVSYKGKEVECVITHEYGHILADQKFRQINGRQRYSDGTTKTRNSEDQAKIGRVRDVFNQARQSGDIYKISEYAAKDAQEFFAESFAMKVMGHEKLPKYIDNMIEEVLK